MATTIIASLFAEQRLITNTAVMLIRVDEMVHAPHNEAYDYCTII